MHVGVIQTNKKRAHIDLKSNQIIWLNKKCRIGCKTTSLSHETGGHPRKVRLRVPAGHVEIKLLVHRFIFAPLSRRGRNDERGARLFVVGDERRIFALGRRGRAADRLEHPAKQKADRDEQNAGKHHDQDREVEYTRIGRVGRVQLPRLFGGRGLADRDQGNNCNTE